jgi:hypothetical protein
VHVFEQQWKLELFTGKVFVWEVSQIYEDNNTFFGDLSAILIENMPIWAEFSTPSNSFTYEVNGNQNCRYY